MSGGKLPVGLCTLQVHSPCHLAAKHCFLHTCLLLTVPFRAMLLPSSSGLRCLGPTAHGVPVYPKVCYIPSLRFTVHRLHFLSVDRKLPPPCSLGRSLDVALQLHVLYLGVDLLQGETPQPLITLCGVVSCPSLIQMQEVQSIRRTEFPHEDGKSLLQQDRKGHQGHIVTHCNTPKVYTTGFTTRVEDAGVRRLAAETKTSSVVTSTSTPPRSAHARCSASRSCRPCKRKSMARHRVPPYCESCGDKGKVRWRYHAVMALKSHLSASISVRSKTPK